MRLFIVIATMFFAAQAHAQSRAECAVAARDFKSPNITIKIGYGMERAGLLFIMKNGHKPNIDEQAKLNAIARSCIIAGLPLTFISKSDAPTMPEVICSSSGCKKNDWLKLDRSISADELAKKVGSR